MPGRPVAASVMAYTAPVPRQDFLRSSQKLIYIRAYALA